MTLMIQWALTIFRAGYGLFFILIGAYGGLSLLSGRGNPFDSAPGAGTEFQNALEATGFMHPLMLGCYVIGGVALLFKRTAPLGIVVLAPFVVVIFFYHTLLDVSLLWAAFWAAGLALLAWQMRAAFLPLVNYTESKEI